jgi:hypothetical protein
MSKIKRRRDRKRCAFLAHNDVPTASRYRSQNGTLAPRARAITIIVIATGIVNKNYGPSNDSSRRVRASKKARARPLSPRVCGRGLIHHVVSHTKVT